MSNSTSLIEHGYLVLADISGYTSFLSQTELDHAQEILTDLLETILKRFKTLLNICKLEGDAVFAYTPEQSIPRGETLLELIEATYIDFRERMKNVRRHTTCTCRACQSIPMLDLKFFIHHGDFVVQNISGTRELAGSDVNLVHRLMKNHITEITGWRAYTLFTQAGLECMRLQLEGLFEGTESYEHLGETNIFAMDMRARYEAFLKNRFVIVGENEALISFDAILNAPPPIVWSWMSEPDKRKLFSLGPHGIKFIPILRPGGRTGAGATTHCVHGKNVAMRETILDWKPFDYYTVEQDSGPLGIIQVTFKLEAVEPNKTHLRGFLRGTMPKWPGFLSRPLIKFCYTRIFDYQQALIKLKAVMEEPPLEILSESPMNEDEVQQVIQSARNNN
jgi:hypothetical protein